MRIPEHKYGLYLLACVCGFVDVTCFVGLNGVFSAMMSGNLLMFAIALSEGQPYLLGFKYVRAFGAFTIGIVIATRVIKFLGGGNNSRKAFWLVWFLIGTALMLSIWRFPGTHIPLRDMLVGLLSAAMGAMTTIIRIHGVPDLATTLFTGTYTALIAESPLVGSRSDRWIRRFLSIFIFVISGAIGGYLAKINPAWSLGLAFTVMSFAMVIFQKSSKDKE
jgi:uncharacterized membrane protein YoaK (UPF0700 family)